MIAKFKSVFFSWFTIYTENGIAEVTAGTKKTTQTDLGGLVI